MHSPCTIPLIAECGASLGIFRDETNLTPGSLKCFTVGSLELTEVVRGLRGVLDSKLGDGRLLVVGVELEV
jgi:hypothetical protein